MTRASERSFSWPLLGAVVVLTPLLLLLLQYGAGRDQGIYLVVARVMQGGGLPYRDAWDFKPPGIFLVYRAALAFGGGMLPVRVLEAIAVASQAFAFGLLTRRFMGSATPGVWGGTFAVLLHAKLEFWHTGQPESFGGPVLAWALVLSTNSALQLPSRVGAGALFAFAALLKPPLGGGGVLVAAILAWRATRVKTSGRFLAVLSPFAAMAAGAIVIVGSVLAWLAIGGAIPDVIETFRDFVPHYTAVGNRLDDIPTFMARAFLEWLTGFSVLVPAGAVLILICREREEGLWGLALICGVTAPQIVGIALQGKFFPYHYGSALPFGALLAAWGAALGFARFRGRTSRLVGVGLALLLFVGITPQTPWLDRLALRLRAAFSPDVRDRILDTLQSAGDVDAAANRVAASWIRGATPPGSFLFVWGFEPILYDETGRAPASRYIYDVPLRSTWYADRSRPHLLKDLAIRKPEAILVERGDVIPRVTGDTLDSAQALAQFTELRELLKRDYIEATDTGRFVCWLRRPES